MERFDLIIKAQRAIMPDGERPATIGIRNGLIAAIDNLETSAIAAQVVSLRDDEVLMPGLVDSHVHICEPGNTDWEGFLTATRAAAAGGITTLVDMPLDSIPTTVSLAALAAKRAAANGQCYVDVGFWGGAIPSNLADLPALHDAGVLGFKSFLCSTGTDDFPHITPRHMKEVMRAVHELGSVFIVHAESDEVLSAIPAVNTQSYREYLLSRPRGAENLAIAEVIEAARATGARAHILHLSSADALAMIASAISDGVKVSVETCPHYLALCAEDIGDGATAAKVGPPVRERSNREKLWGGLADGTLSMIVSDHSPCTPAMKEIDSGDFGAAWGGISSLQLALPVAWTEARRRGYSLIDIARWMAREPAALAGLENRGLLAVGCQADFSIFAPDENFVVEAATLHHRHPLTPYLGFTLFGVVRQTYLRGDLIDPMGQPKGMLLSGTQMDTTSDNANIRRWG